MVKKIFGAKSITHLVYGILMLFPFLSILSTVCYVAVNKNAKDSYSGSEEFTYYEKVQNEYPTNNVNQYSDIQQNNYYWFSFNNHDILSGYVGLQVTYDTTITIYDYSSIDLDDSPIEIEMEMSFPNIVEINCYASELYLMFYNDDRTMEFDLLYYNDLDYSINGNCLVKSFDNFVVDDLVTEVIKPCTLVDYNYVERTIEQSTLDNAFDYAVDKFVKDNNSGRLNFFQWFSGLFLDYGNGVNARYLAFVNWYLNYALLVSSGYILFLVLIWFINYCRYILDKGHGIAHGGF